MTIQQIGTVLDTGTKFTKSHVSSGENSDKQYHEFTRTM